MAKFNWSKINTENLDYRHKLSMERNDVADVGDAKSIVTRSDSTLRRKVEKTANLLESIAFVYKPPAILITQGPKITSKSIHLAWKTASSIGGLSLICNIEMKARPGKPLILDEPMIGPLKQSGAEMSILVSSSYIQSYLAGDDMSNQDIILWHKIILKYPLISDKIVKFGDSEMVIDISISQSFIATFPTMTLTTQRTKDLEKLSSFIFDKKGIEMEIAYTDKYHTLQSLTSC